MRTIACTFLAALAVLAACLTGQARAQNWVNTQDIQAPTQISGTLERRGEFYVLRADDGTRYTLDSNSSVYQYAPNAFEPLGPKMKEISDLLGQKVVATGIVSQSYSPTNEGRKGVRFATGKVLSLVDVAPASSFAVGETYQQARGFGAQAPGMGSSQGAPYGPGMGSSQGAPSGQGMGPGMAPGMGSQPAPGMGPAVSPYGGTTPPGTVAPSPYGGTVAPSPYGDGRAMPPGSVAPSPRSGVSPYGSSMPTTPFGGSTGQTPPPGGAVQEYPYGNAPFGQPAVPPTPSTPNTPSSPAPRTW